jgi:selenide,water dikinase
VDLDLLSDAQTSGGLFIAVAPKDREILMSRLQDRGVADAAAIGEVTDTGRGSIRVLM